jgi:hypothetical protein
LESGKAPAESDSVMGQFSGNSALSAERALASFIREALPFRFERTMVPLIIPTLWFYKCNNCEGIFPIEKLRLRGHTFGRLGALDMLLCDLCLTAYNSWNKRWNGSGAVVRVTPFRKRFLI